MERTPGSLRAAADHAWPCECLDEPTVTPKSSLCTLCSGCSGEGFRLLPDTESESLDSEGEATDLCD